jgi:fructokinase
MRVVIVVAGEALVDLLVCGDDVVATPGGAPYNVARGCARLGLPTALLATLSSDGFGARLAEGLASAGVSDALLQRAERPTTLAVAELDAAGGASYRFYIEGTSAASLRPQALPDATAAFVTGGLGLAVEPMATAIETMVLGIDPGALVIVDLNCRPKAIDDRAAYVARLSRVFARADVVKASDEDLAWLRPGGAPAAAGELLGSGISAVLVTAGGLSTTIVTAPGAVTVPVVAVPVVDTIGAGDAFTAGFTSWWLATGRGRDDLGDTDALTAAVDAAHDVAAVIVGRRGADPPWRDELPPDWVA